MKRELLNQNENDRINDLKRLYRLLGNHPCKGCVYLNMYLGDIAGGSNSMALLESALTDHGPGADTENCNNPNIRAFKMKDVAGVVQARMHEVIQKRQTKQGRDS